MQGFIGIGSKGMGKRSAKFIEMCREILDCDLDTAIDIYKYACFKKKEKKKRVKEIIKSAKLLCKVLNANEKNTKILKTNAISDEQPRRGVSNG